MGRPLLVWLWPLLGDLDGTRSGCAQPRESTSRGVISGLHQRNHGSPSGIAERPMTTSGLASITGTSPSRLSNQSRDLTMQVSHENTSE